MIRATLASDDHTPTIAAALRRRDYALLAWLAAQPAPPVATRWMKTARNEPFLEVEGSVYIAATHSGKGYCRDGRVPPETRRLLEPLAGGCCACATAGSVARRRSAHL